MPAKKRRRTRQAARPAGQALDVLASPVTLVVLAGVTGVLLAQLSGSRKGGEGK